VVILAYNHGYFVVQTVKNVGPKPIVATSTTTSIPNGFAVWPMLTGVAIAQLARAESCDRMTGTRNAVTPASRCNLMTVWGK
jgi:hypothetical protein